MGVKIGMCTEVRAKTVSFLWFVFIWLCDWLTYSRMKSDDDVDIDDDDAGDDES